MNDAYIFSHVDHTLLAASSKWTDVKELCDEAVQYKTASVCVPPSYIKSIREAYPSMNICTVIGFPLGYDSIPVKAVAVQTAIENTADELDMVINLTDVKNGRFETVKTEVGVLKQIAGKKILKVIIETCYLTEDEKIELCGIVTEAGADYIKTSTGFGTAGATLADIELFKKHVGPDVKIKAAGGIRKREDMVAFLELGCSRLGTSSAVKILTGEKSEGY
jgi:deoxyribose-phosphate aldolase